MSSRWREALRWLCLVVVPTAMWPLAAWLHRETLPPRVLTLERAEFVAHGGERPPPAAAGWSERSLPHEWRVDDEDVVEGWYRLTFRAEPSDRAPWAVYLPAVGMNAAVLLDQRPIGAGGRFAEPLARNWNRPLFFAFAGDLLRSGENVLHVHVRADRPGGGFLGRVSIGPEDALEPAYDRRRILEVTTVATITIAATMIALFTTSLWLWRRNEAYYGWYGLTALSLGLMHAHMLVVEPPLPTLLWMGLFYAVTGWCVLFAVLGLLDFIGERHPPVVHGALAYGLLGSGAILALGLLGSTRLHQIGGVWLIVPSILIAYAITRVMAAIRVRPSADLYAIQIAVAAAAACGLHDWLMLNGLLSQADGFFLPYAVPAVLAGMAWVLLRRFVGALDTSEALVAELERRVTAKRNELERAHERVRDIDRGRIIAEERERVMREMHDGLGAHFVSTLALLEQPGATGPAISDALRRALEEMRLMADSLEPVDGDLSSALGRLRAHVQPRLEAAGIGVDWRVEDVPAVPGLGPHGVLQLLRILQEAITNVLKHSGARRVRVETGTDTVSGAASVYVELADDGHGMQGSDRRGRGLANMRRRAEEIGARLEIESSPRGTAVRLWIATGQADAPPK